MLAPVSSRLGLIQASTAVLHSRFPEGSKTCLRTFVNILCRNGMYCFLDFEEELSIFAKPRIQSFNTERLMLISRVSFIRSEVWLKMSRADSEPARSTRYRMPSSRVAWIGSWILMRQMACVREDPSFFSVEAVCRNEVACSIRARSSAVLATLYSFAPASWVSPKESSRIWNGARKFNRSSQGCSVICDGI